MWLRYPSSLAVDSLEDIFYTTSPLWNGEGGWNNLKYPTALYALNPETGKSTLIHEFNETLTDYLTTGATINVEYNKELYIAPIGFNVTNILYESAKELDFLITNSHQGTLKVVSTDKY